MTDAITLAQLNINIANCINRSPSTQNVWVTAELSDVAVRNRHCYMELLQKDDNGQQVAKARAVIWANIFGGLKAKFELATQQSFASGIKLMLKVSANMHPVFGLSLIVTDIDPNYTMGDLLRRRREIIDRLTKEGIINLNKSLQWNTIPQNIAIISAPGAAGYGDFMNQLLNNPSRLRFNTRLFAAIMQGVNAPQSIINQLIAIYNDETQWDCVVIIRGGGATSDLQCFEDYELAANIAQFSMPIIIGIGHERDITLLDYVANMRVKTPTAAAEWLISIGENALARLDNFAHNIYRCVTDLLTGCKEQLSYYDGLLPVLPFNATRNAATRLNKAVALLSGISSRLLAPAYSRLEVLKTCVQNAGLTALKRRHDHLDAIEQLLGALSPQAVLNRGYSITRIDGHVVTQATALAPGQTIETTLASGSITSTIINAN